MSGLSRPSVQEPAPARTGLHLQAFTLTAEQTEELDAPFVGAAEPTGTFCSFGKKLCHAAGPRAMVIPEVVTVTRSTEAAAGPGPVMDQAFWDGRYRSRGTLWSGRPNPQLVNDVAGLPPGCALDIGCGEGADAFWLADRGWQVTAVDLSPVALERGAARARELGDAIARRIAWQQVDLVGWIPAAGRYDLVSAQFMHLPQPQRENLHRRLAAAVAPGGVLLVVGHHPWDLRTTVSRPNVPELFYTAADVAAVLDPRQWTILAEEARPRPAVDPDGREVTIHDAVLTARRTG